jgi:hypothetical protein
MRLGENCTPNGILAARCLREVFGTILFAANANTVHLTIYEP